MKAFQTLTLTILTLLAFVSGCSDLKKSKVLKKPIESSRFNAGCKLEVSEFKSIMERDITTQIDCLQRNIDLFMRVVESDKPGFLSRNAFELYVQKNVPDFDVINVRAIKSVFEVSHLLFGEDREYLSPVAVKKIFDFLYLFNREMPKIYPFFKSKEETPFNLHDLQRIRVYKAADSMSRALLDIFTTDRAGKVNEINVIEIIESLTTENNESTVEQIKAVLFIKKLLLGGDNDVLTHLELQDALYKLAPAASVAFDIARVKYIDLTQKSLMELLSSDLDVLERLLFYAPNSTERLFSVDDLITAVPYFLDDETSIPDLKKYRKEALELKMLLMTDLKWSEDQDLTNQEWVLPTDIKVLLGHAKDAVRRGATYHRIYEFFKPYLDTPGSVSINYNNYLLQFPTHEKYVREFARISNDYRFFWGTFDMPYYNHGFRRNANAMVEMGLLEYGFFIVSRRYGETTQGLNGFGMRLVHIENLFKIFGDFLIDEEIIMDGRQKSTSNNIALLTTLFQSMSNGDNVLNVDEASAMFSQVFVSMKHADWFEAEMGKRCAKDEKGRITDIQCHRDNIFSLVCEKFQAQFPLLLSTLGIKKCSDAGNVEWRNEYLQTVEFVARTCETFADGTLVPIGKDDYMPMLVMLMTIEGTILRYDANKNNKLDPAEVREAYDKTFKQAIQALVDDQAPILAKLPFNLGSGVSRKIYYYLMKYNSVPEKFRDYMKLLTIGAPTSHRDTIAAVLKIIIQQTATTGPKFDCERLR